MVEVNHPPEIAPGEDSEDEVPYARGEEKTPEKLRKTLLAPPPLEHA